MTRNILFLILTVCISGPAFGQNSVGIGTTNPNDKAAVEIKSNNKGLLIPRMNSAQRLAIAPGMSERGLLVFDGDLNQFMFYDGTAWSPVAVGDSSLWEQNSGDLYYDIGRVGIGTSSPSAVFQVLNDNGLTTTTGWFESNGSISGASYTLYVNNEADPGGQQNGIYSTVTANANPSQLVRGLYSGITNNNSNAPMYGAEIYVDSAGSGTHYGVKTTAEGSGNYALHAQNVDSEGWAGYFDGRVNITKRVGIGVDDPISKIDAYGTGKRTINIVNESTAVDTAFGIYTQMNPIGPGPRFGQFIKVIPEISNASNLFGMWSVVTEDGPGQHVGLVGKANGDGNTGVRGVSSGTGFGVKGVNTSSTGFAGYFDGNAYVQDRLEIRDKIFLRPVGNANGGEIELFDDDGDQTVTIRAGQAVDNGAEILLYNDAGVKTIELDAEWGSGNGRVITGELEITGGSDLAEHFDIADEASTIQPGMLVSIDPNSTGKLHLTSKAYDKRVAGVVSGANGVRPGMLMGQEESIADGELPIALTGRVYVKTNNNGGTVNPGDLLTSSKIPGEAMKAKNYRKARGAVIGKALTTSDENGFVLILVNLQ